MTRWCIAMLAVMTWFSADAAAQSTSRLDRARDQSKPRRSADDEARRHRQNHWVDADRIRDDIRSDGLLRKRAGYYVYPPDRYRADNWSPRLRPRYDYSSYRSTRSRGAGQRSLQRRFRSNYPRYRSGGWGAYGGGYGPFQDDYYGDAYDQGRYDADNEYTDYIAAQRAGQLFDANREKLDEGMSYFRAGRYGRAAVAWLGASKLDQSDAVSRIHAAHALFTLGRYTDAVKLLERAFELAPILTESTYDIRTDYTDQSDFARHLATLKTYVAKHPNDVAATTLLGYVLSYTEGPAAAYSVLRRARRLRPGDTFVERLWRTARAVSPQDGVEPVERRPTPRPDATERDTAEPAKGAGRTGPATRRDVPLKPVRLAD